MEPDDPVNVLNGPLMLCGRDPMTGFFRDGHCNTCEEDAGSHTVCAVMTAEFLAYSKYVGNDLSTPMPQYGFDGLQDCSPGIGGAFVRGVFFRRRTKAAGQRSIWPRPIGGRSMSCRWTC